MPSDAATPLGVYVHWPYCARICPYCDFNVYKTRDVDAARWSAALNRDLAHWRAKTGARKLASLYFGGGTPSLAPLSVIEDVVKSCADLWGFEDGAEVTLEANPTDAEQKRFEAFAGAGVNRLSLGIQSFDDSALKFLGRDHNGAEARTGAELAMKIFSRISFDLIYALPDQSAAAWREALHGALAISAPHLSLYQLTIEPQTAFAKAVARGQWAPPENDLAADLFDIAQDMTVAAGMPAYEVSNHAAPGGESKHNLIYWTGGDYVGVGPGAHGRLTIESARGATETFLGPEAYLAAVESAGNGASLEEPLDAEAVLVERLSMGMRLASGMTLTDKEMVTLGERAKRLDDLVTDNLIQRQGLTVKATAKGRRLLNAVLSTLLT